MTGPHRSDAPNARTATTTGNAGAGDRPVRGHGARWLDHFGAEFSSMGSWGSWGSSLAAVKFYHDDDDDDDDDDGGGGCFNCCFLIAAGHGQYDLHQDSAAFEGVPVRGHPKSSALRVASCQSHPFSLTSATPALYCIS